MKLLMLLILVAIIVAIFVHQEAPRAYAVVGPDTSLSVSMNCANIEQVISALMKRQGMREGSTIAFFKIGDGPNDPEPKRLLELIVPGESENFYNRDQARKGYEKKVKELTAAIRQSCEAIAPTKFSPILRMVTRSIEHLRTLCPKDGPCYATFKTDLVDDVDAQLAPVIAKAAKDPSIALPPELSGSIDNAGIQVAFCGAAEVRARKAGSATPPSPETLKRLWTGIFRHPELIFFEPFCGNVSDGLSQQSRR